MHPRPDEDAYEAFGKTLHPRLRHYLEDVGKRLAGLPQRQKKEQLFELGLHLQETVRSELQSGRSQNEDQAVAETILRFGTAARDLGDELLEAACPDLGRGSLGLAVSCVLPAAFCSAMLGLVLSTPAASASWLPALFLFPLVGGYLAGLLAPRYAPQGCLLGFLLIAALVGDLPQAVLLAALSLPACLGSQWGKASRKFAVARSVLAGGGQVAGQAVGEARESVAAKVLRIKARRSRCASAPARCASAPAWWPVSIAAAWLSWGVVFTVLYALINDFAPAAVPDLLGARTGQKPALWWTSALSAALLVGWAVGGLLLGNQADRSGRKKALLIGLALCALGTSTSAFAPNLWMLAACWAVAGLGGGAWGACAALAWEIAPKERRAWAGALLYTAAPAGLLAAGFLKSLSPGGAPAAWRDAVFLCGLLPAAAALLVFLLADESARWAEVGESWDRPPSPAELFSARNRARTLGGFLMVSTGLITWWACQAFIPVVTTKLAQTSAASRGLDGAAMLALAEWWKAVATGSFYLGGILGTLLAVAAWKTLDPRRGFAIYFALSAASVLAAFRPDLAPEMRPYMYFPIGMTMFGLFGYITIYLPALFAIRLRGTGAGFCYNTGRVVAAAGVFLVRWAMAGTLENALSVLLCIGLVPLLGLLALPWVMPPAAESED